MKLENKIIIGPNGSGKTRFLYKAIIDLYKKNEKEIKNKGEKGKNFSIFLNNDNMDSLGDIEEEDFFYDDGKEILKNVIFISNDRSRRHFVENKELSRIFSPFSSFFNFEAKINHILKDIVSSVFSLSNVEIKLEDYLKENDKKTYENYGKMKVIFNSFVEGIKKDDDSFIFNSERLFKNEKKFSLKNSIFNGRGLFDGERSSTGIKSYSMIKFLAEMIKFAKENSLSIGNDEKEYKDFYLIIDEPEKFLHPQLIKKFAIYLKDISKNFNIIMTSHSPLFISYFVDNEDTEIVFVESEKSFKICELIDNLDENNKGEKNVSLILKNELMRSDFFRILFSKKIILVEDLAHKVIFDLLICENKKLLNEEIELFVTFGYIQMIGLSKTLDFLKEKFNLDISYWLVHDTDTDKRHRFQYGEKYKDKVLYTFNPNPEEEIFGKDWIKKIKEKTQFPAGIIFEWSKIKNQIYFKNIREKMKNEIINKEEKKIIKINNLNIENNYIKSRINDENS